MINIPLQINIEGAKQTAQELAAIQAAIRKTASESSGILELSRALGITFEEAKKLSQEMGTGGANVAKFASALKQLETAGAGTADRFNFMNKTLGVTADQFLKLEKTLASLSQREKEAAAESAKAAESFEKQAQAAKRLSDVAELAQSIGKSYQSASRLAKGLNLEPETARQAVQVLRQLNAVNTDAATKYQILRQQLGLTEVQFSKLDAIAKKTVDNQARSNSVLTGIGVGIGANLFNSVQNFATQIPSQISAATLQFEKFRTVLRTLYGDEAKAQIAFGTIQQFAATTPFQLDEVLGSFIALKNRGIDPTNETLRKMGDIAASQGKSLSQFTEAILDATTGENERLKEFGISAKQAGDKVSFTFKGVTETVAKTPEAISSAILKFGELKGVAGGMEAQSKTLGGQLSNLQDNLTAAAVALGDELVPILVDFVKSINESGPGLTTFARNIGTSLQGPLQLLVTVFKLGADNSKLLEVAVTTLALRFAAIQVIPVATAIATFGQAAIASAAQAGTAGAAMQVLSLQLKQVAVSAALAYGPLVALAAAVGATLLIKTTKDMENFNTELEGFSSQAQVAGDTAINLATKTKSLNDAFKDSGKFTEEQKKQAADLIKINDGQVASLQETLTAVQRLTPANEDQANAQAGLVANLQASIKALKGQNDELEKNLGSTKKAADRTQTLKDRLDEINQAYEKNQSAAVNAEADAQTEIANLQEEGVINKREAESRKLAAAQERINQELTAERDRLSKLQSLPASKDEKENKARLDAIQSSYDKINKLEQQQAEGRLAVKRKQAEDEAAAAQEAEAIAVAAVDKQLAAGTITKEQAERKKLELTETRIKAEIEAEKQGENDKGKIAQLNSQLYQNQLAQREADEKAALQKIVDATKQAEDAIAASQQDRILKVRQAQLSGGLSETDATRQIEAIQKESSDRVVEIKKRELAQVQAARQAGTISSKDAADQEKQLRKEVADATIAQVEREIAARRRATLETLEAANVTRQTQTENQSANLQNQVNLLGARNNLQQAMNGLLATEYETAIKSAEANGNSLEADRLRQELKDKQIEQELAAFEFKQQELALNQQLRDLDAQRAVDEAEYNLQVAIANGARSEEIQKLQEIVNRNKEKVDLLRQVNALENQTLDAQKKQSQEKQKQNNIDKQGKGGAQTGATVQGGGRSQFQTGAQLQQFFDAQRQVSEFVSLYVDKATGITKDGQLITAAAARLANTANQADSTVTVTAANGVQFKNEFAGVLANTLSPALRDLTFTLAGLIKSGQLSLGQVNDAVSGAEKANLPLIDTLKQLIASVQGNTKAQQDNGINQLVSAIKPRKMGGPVAAGDLVLAGEEGPELISMSRAGLVWTAAQTAALVPQLTMPAIATTVMDNPALLIEVKSLRKELQGLRGDVREKPFKQENKFEFVNHQEDPVKQILRVNAALMRSRYQ